MIQLKKLFTIALFLTVAGFATETFGQQRPPVSGGKSSVSVDDQYVKYAADFAVKAKNAQNKQANADAQEYSLENIVKAEQQVVAGMKFYVCMELYAASNTEGEDGVQFFALAEVYRNLKNEYSLVGWSEPESCD